MPHLCTLTLQAHACASLLPNHPERETMKMPSLDGGGSAGLGASPPRGFPKPATGKRGRELWKPVFRQPKDWELKLSHMSGLASVSYNNKLKMHKYYLALEIPNIVCMGIAQEDPVRQSGRSPPLVTSNALDAGGRCSPTYSQRRWEASLGFLTEL